MKRILLGLFTVASLGIATTKVNAQAFTPAADTVWLNYTGNQNIELHNDLTALGSPVNLKWKAIPSMSNIQADATWSSSTVFSVCDNYNCYVNTGGNYITGGVNEFTSPNVYPVNIPTTFKAGFNLVNATTGTRYVTISLEDVNTGYKDTITFIATKLFPTSTANVTKGADDIVLYPNPVRDEVNVLFNDMNVSNIAVYNVIGKTMVVYRTTGASAKMDLSKFPSGVYFLRMSDAKGDVVATKRFTKQ